MNVPLASKMKIPITSADKNNISLTNNTNKVRLNTNSNFDSVLSANVPTKLDEIRLQI